MRCVKVKYIEILPIQEILIYKINLQEITSFYSLKVHFTFKIPSIHMDLLINHMSTYIYRVVFQYFNHKNRGMLIV
jgi:hypothetical protein